MAEMVAAVMGAVAAKAGLVGLEGSLAMVVVHVVG